MIVTWNRVYPATTQFHLRRFTQPPRCRPAHAGISRLILCGCVGENTALEYDEKLAVLEAMRKAINGRVPVLTGVAENTTRLAGRFARDAGRIGIDGLMVLPAMIYIHT